MSARPNYDWVKAPAARRRLIYLYESRRFDELREEEAATRLRELRRETAARMAGRGQGAA